MPHVEIYTKSWCPFCAHAKERLEQLGVDYEEIDVTSDPEKELEMVMRSRRQTVPQIFVNGVHLGGSDDLVAAENSGRLNQLLTSADEPTNVFQSSATIGA